MLIREVIEYDSRKNRMMEENTNGWPWLIYWGSIVDPKIWDWGFLVVVTHYYQTFAAASVGMEKEAVEHENHWRYLFFDWFSFVDFAYNVIWAQVGFCGQIMQLCHMLSDWLLKNGRNELEAIF